MSLLSSSTAFGSSGTISYSSYLTLPLHVSGNMILDSNGNTVYLRGVVKGICFVDSVGAYWMGVNGWNPTRASQELDIIKSWGANVIRMHETAQYWIQNTVDPVSGEAHRQIIHDLAAMCAQKGLYLMIDTYFCIAQNSPGAQLEGLPWSPYITSQEAAIMGSSAGGDTQQGFINMWANFASYMKDLPNVIIEQYNEPHGDSTAKASYFSVIQRGVTAIRAAGFTGLITYQWDWGSSVDLSSPPSGFSSSPLSWVTQYPITDPLNNLVIQTHQYWDDGGYYFATRSDTPVTSITDLTAAVQATGVTYVLSTLNKPVLIGEFGGDTAYSDQTAAQTAFANQLQVYANLGISYSAFWFRSQLEHPLLTSETSLQPNIYGTILQTALKMNTQR